LNSADIIILIILGFAGYRGYQRGFMVSLLSVVAFVLAIILAFMFLDWGVQILDQWINGFNGILPYLAFVLIFIVVSVGISILGKILKKAIDLTLLGSFDSLAGGLVGVLTWVLGLSILIWLTGLVDLEIPKSWTENSMLYSRIESVAPAVIDTFSEYLPFLKSLVESIADRLQPALP